MDKDIHVAKVRKLAVGSVAELEPKVSESLVVSGVPQYFAFVFARERSGQTRLGKRKFWTETMYDRKTRLTDLESVEEEAAVHRSLCTAKKVSEDTVRRQME